MKIAFIGRKQGTSHRKARDYLSGYTLERPRLGEEAGLEASGLVKTDDFADADLVYVRVNPEQTNRRAERRIQEAEQRVPPDTPVINSISGFDYYANKIRTFETWKARGISCPRFWPLTLWQSRTRLTEEIQSLARENEGIYLRTHNEDSGKGIFFLEADADAADIGKTVRQLRWRSLTNRVSGSKLLAVAPIDARDPRGVSHVFRVHVVGETLLCGYALVGTGSVIHARDVRPEHWDNFLDYNRLLLQLVKDRSVRDTILNAVHSLNAQVGAVEFFYTNQGLCFLELNPQWGGKHKLGRMEFQERLGDSLNGESLEWVQKWLSPVDFYRDFYTELTRWAVK